jgi:hypothetical protein
MEDMMMKRLFPVVMIGVCALGSAVFQLARGAENMTIEDACAAIGLTPGEAPFTQCVQSLQRSVSMPDSALPTSKNGPEVAVGSGETRVGHRSEYACRVIGLNPTTARYSYCVGNLRQTLFETTVPGYQN